MTEKNSIMEQKIRNLQHLLDLSKLMNKEIDLDHLLELILRKTTETMNAERSSLFLYDDEKKELWSKIAQELENHEIRFPLGVGIAGIVAQTKKSLNIANVHEDLRFNREFDQTTKFSTRSILCIPLIGSEGKLIGVLEVLNKKSGEIFNDEDENLLSAFAIHVVVALERTRFIQSFVQAQRLEESLKLAKIIQMNSIPKKFPPFPEKVDVIDIYAHIKPAKNVGGDLYTYFLIDNHLCFAIGDVADKGIHAALFMVITITAFRSFIGSNLIDLPSLMFKLNNCLCENNNINMFCTFFCGFLNLKTGELEYCNAGHNLPYLLRNDGSLQVLESRPVFPLGLSPNQKYSSYFTLLHPGEAIFLYTDGVNEASDAEDVEYSYTRLENILKKGNQLSSKNFIESLLLDIKNFVGKAEQSDDIAILMIRYLSRQ